MLQRDAKDWKVYTWSRGVALGIQIANNSDHRDKTITLFSVFPNTAIRLPNPRSSVLIAKRFSAIILIKRPPLAPPKMIHFSNAYKRPPKSFSIQ